MRTIKRQNECPEGPESGHTRAFGHGAERERGGKADERLQEHCGAREGLWHGEEGEGGDQDRQDPRPGGAGGGEGKRQPEHDREGLGAGDGGIGNDDAPPGDGGPRHEVLRQAGEAAPLEGAASPARRKRKECATLLLNRLKRVDAGVTVIFSDEKCHFTLSQSAQYESGTVPGGASR